jgi:outer membrane immunogenic protein
MSKYLLVALLAGVAATPAVAQDRAPFTGARVEGLIGYDSPRVQGDSFGGVVYGARVGYDFQSGGAVFGVDGEVTDSSADTCIGGVNVPADTLCARAKRDLYVGGRIGAVVGDRALIYGLAGYTNGRFGLAYDDGGTGANDFRSAQNLDGVRVGAGLQYAISRNAFVNAEYRYSNYENGVSRHQVLGGFGVRF